MNKHINITNINTKYKQFGSNFYWQIDLTEPKQKLHC